LKNNFATCLISEKLLNNLFWKKLKYLLDHDDYRRKISKNAAQFSSSNAEQIIIQEIQELLNINKMLK